MNSDSLEAAYALIWEIKEGRFEVGSKMTVEQVDLLRLLVSDLVPAEEMGKENWEALVRKIARADTYWNHQTQMVIDEIYSLKERGNDKEVEVRKYEFLEACPSAWYRSMVE